MPDRNLILAGDIGGTKTHLALFSVHGEKLRVESERRFSSKGYSGLAPVLEDYFARSKRPSMPLVSALPAPWSTVK